MVDPQHAGLSITRQCRLVSITRSSFYYASRGDSPLNLRLMRRIDEQFLETPFYGSRQMTRWLRRQGDMVSRKRVRRLMRLLGVHALFQRPRTSQPHPAAPDLSLPAPRSADHAAEPRVVHGCHLHSPAAGLSVPGCRDGLGEPQGAVLAPVQHARCACRRALAMPANKKKDPRYAGIYRDMPGYSGMGPRRLRPMIVGVPPRVGAAYAGIGRRNCGSRLLIHQMAFKPRFPGVLGSLK